MSMNHEPLPRIAALFAAGALALAFSVATPASAADDTSFKVSGDWISQTARHGDLDYAIPDDLAIGSVARVDPESDSGYRFRFEVMRGKAFFFASYTSYDATTSDRVRDPGDSLTGTLHIDDYCLVCDEAVSLATADYDVDYSVLEIGAGYNLRENSPFGLRLSGGVRQASVEENFHVFYSDNLAGNADADIVDQGTDMDAFGLFIGIEPEYKFNSLIRLFGRLQYTALMGDVDQTFLYRTSTNGGQTGSVQADLDSSENRAVETIEASFGVEFTITDVVSVSGGYEFQTWQNYPGFLKHTSESGEVTFDLHTTDLGFDGPFVRVSLSF